MVKVPPIFRLLILCLAGTPLLYAQNLLRNPSFEQYADCPEQLGNFNKDVADWTSPTLASTDYFNACSSEMGTPENFNGSQTAEFGKGYAGLYLFAPNDYREYVQGELREPLKAREEYEISFFISLAERSDFAVREFGVLLSKNRVDRPIKKELSKMQLYKDKENVFTSLLINNKEFYNETSDWVRLHSSFTARGGERFVTIGNFENNAATRTHRTSRNAKQGAYYYLDMVVLQAQAGATAAHNIPAGSSPAAYALGTQHHFAHVLFGFDDYRLTENAKTELRKLYGYLSRNGDLKITINGHTDNIGSEAYNRKLSGDRCRAVTDYLRELGLEEERMGWVPHGFEDPVADNGSEAGRKQNRRVAFSLSRLEP